MVNLLLFYSPTKIDSLAPVFRAGENMANVTSEIHNISIDNNDNDRAGLFFSSVDPRYHKVT